jgi:lipopolysaccharide biosynthesis glycosyltransferase
MKKHEIPVFFACDDNYIPFLGTALHTMIKNASKDYHYKAIVLNAGIKDETVINRPDKLTFNVCVIEFTNVAH